MVVGASAPTLHDVHLTSTTKDTPMAGPEVQANAIWTALRGLPLQSGPGVLNLLAIVLLAVAVPLATIRVRVTRAALGGLVLGIVYAVAAQLAFESGLVSWSSPRSPRSRFPSS